MKKVYLVMLLVVFMITVSLSAQVTVEILEASTPNTIISGVDSELLKVRFTYPNDFWFQLRAADFSIDNSFNLLNMFSFEDVRWTAEPFENWESNISVNSQLILTTPVWYANTNSSPAILTMRGRVVVPDDVQGPVRIDIGFESLDYLWISGNPQTSSIFPQRKTLIINQPVANDDQISPSLNIDLNNYPNPFSVGTKITYNITKSGPARIEIFNIKGQSIKILENAQKNSGEYQLSWDGLDSNGRSVAEGIYFCKFSTKEKTVLKKMTLVK